jgi:hypothetical protein
MSTDPFVTLNINEVWTDRALSVDSYNKSFNAFHTTGKEKFLFCCVSQPMMNIFSKQSKLCYFAI